MSRPIVVNLFGGPGIGKSRIAAGVYSSLKFANVNCELVTEYAKDLVWDKAGDVLADQVHVFGEQYHRYYRLRDKVDLIVTDGPLLLSLIYGKSCGSTFHQFVSEVFNHQRNLNFLLEREGPYHQTGRLQSEDEATAIDREIAFLLTSNKVPHGKIAANKHAIPHIAIQAIHELSRLG